MTTSVEIKVPHVVKGKRVKVVVGEQFCEYITASGETYTTVIYDGQELHISEEDIPQ